MGEEGRANTWEDEHKDEPRPSPPAATTGGQAAPGAAGVGARVASGPCGGAAVCDAETVLDSPARCVHSGEGCLLASREERRSAWIQAGVATIGAPSITLSSASSLPTFAIQRASFSRPAAVASTSCSSRAVILCLKAASGLAKSKVAHTCGLSSLSSVPEPLALTSEADSLLLLATSAQGGHGA